MLEGFLEGKVYEILLVTASNITPAGVIREGNKFRFKLFPGKSFHDLLNDPKASIQITNDVELLVKHALNLEDNSQIEEKDGWRWIKGLPGFYGVVKWQIKRWDDEIGNTEVLSAEFLPLGLIPGELPTVPFSRADCTLVEMAVLFTRYLVSQREELGKKIKELHDLYKHLGGRSWVAEYIIKNIEYRSE